MLVTKRSQLVMPVMRVSPRFKGSAIFEGSSCFISAKDLERFPLVSNPSFNALNAHFDPSKSTGTSNFSSFENVLDAILVLSSSLKESVVAKSSELACTLHTKSLFWLAVLRCNRFGLVITTVTTLHCDHRCIYGATNKQLPLHCYAIYTWCKQDILFFSLPLNT